MNTCDSCMYWDKWANVPNGGMCTNPALQNLGDPPLNGLAQQEDGDGRLQIYTGAKFGCVHHDMLPIGEGTK